MGPLQIQSSWIRLEIARYWFPMIRRCRWQSRKNLQSAWEKQGMCWLSSCSVERGMMVRLGLQKQIELQMPEEKGASRSSSSSPTVNALWSLQSSMLGPNARRKRAKQAIVATWETCMIMNGFNLPLSSVHSWGLQALQLHIRSATIYGHLTMRLRKTLWPK